MNRPKDDEPKQRDEVREPRLSAEDGLRVASEYFMGKADVQKAAKRIADRLSELEIDYAIAGGLAVTAHGLVRVTADVDLLLRADGLERFRDECRGRGWVEKFPGSRGVRDTTHNIPVDVLLTGGYPGDGIEKAITFPDPAVAGEWMDGIRYLTLSALVELKIASAMTAPERPRDYDDVIRLIQVNELAEDYGQQLHPYVQDKYVELWGYSQRPSGEY